MLVFFPPVILRTPHGFVLVSFSILVWYFVVGLVFCLFFS